ncbi:glutamate--cysteine ligase regulatory subunit isoform X2 [Prorops nasuta]|uniref:glutamate--cysteine ligase regulatory subunit isoform X2 n=1 Tax=Prorops nasuta TaxID=863751 RepID=UPI0034CD6663
MSQNILVHTGNILILDETKTKASQNPADELTETLKIILRDSPDIRDGLITINRPENADLNEVDRKELKITVKVYLSSAKSEFLTEALKHVFSVLNTEKIESLIIAYNSNDKQNDILPSLKQLWSSLEKLHINGKICSLGISDVSTNTFIELYEWAKIKPSIVQINLAACCVVPQALQTFTKENFIQLLTHSDPSQMLPPEILEEIFGPAVNLNWIVKYQVHLKCRGILSSKGYLVNINKEKDNK